jgi:hypothetical protein
VSFEAKSINAATLLKDGEYSLIFVKFGAQIHGGKGVSHRSGKKQQHTTGSGMNSIELSSGAIMLIAGVSLLLSVLVLVSGRLLYDRSHVFFLLCSAVERWFRRTGSVVPPDRSLRRSGKRGIASDSAKVRGAAAP